MYLPTNTSRTRLREAENARRNRLEIVKALADGQISRRDLFKWGLFTSTGLIAAKNGLSVFAPSAYAQVPTGAPRSPLFGAVKFHERMHRAEVVQPYQLGQSGTDAVWQGAASNQPRAKRLSWHDDFTREPGNSLYWNPVTGKGPIEGRPPGEYFAHQRWATTGSNSDLFPKVGYLMSIGQIQPGTRFCAEMPEQNANAMWSFGPRPPAHIPNADGSRLGYGAPCLFKVRYGEPAVMRIYNDLPVDRTKNGGFGRNEMSTHFHNAHHGAESDGACNAYHFPGTFYDYHWSLTLARRDLPDVREPNDTLRAKKASGPDDNGGLRLVEGDYRELQCSLWLHDHRFFFTAENVHKGIFGLANLYSGPDRGSETLNDGINLRLPSGSVKSWGNSDFDVNIAISNPATSQDGQLLFDIFDTDGFLGDMLLVNGGYCPYFEVLPRRYRFRFLNASMSRFIKLALVVNSASVAPTGTKVPFYFIANDGNLLVKPIKLSDLDEQGVGERYDVVVDFRSFKAGDSIYLTNLLKQTSGRKPLGPVTVGQALAGDPEDPCVGPLLEFRVRNAVESVDAPGTTIQAGGIDPSANFADVGWTGGTKTLTRQIPVVPQYGCANSRMGVQDQELRAGLTASAFRTVRKARCFHGRSKSTGNSPIPSTPIASRRSYPSRAKSSTGRSRTRAAGGITPSTCISRKASPSTVGIIPYPPLSGSCARTSGAFARAVKSSCRSDLASSAAPTSTIATTPPMRTLLCSCACRCSPRIRTRGAMGLSMSSRRRPSQRRTGCCGRILKSCPRATRVRPR